MAELYHNLNNIHHPNERNDRIRAIQKHVTSLRSLVREKSLILGDSIKPKAYELTDFAKAVASSENTFDSEKWFDLERSLSQQCNNVLKTIPKLEGDLNQIQAVKRVVQQGAAADG